MAYFILFLVIKILIVQYIKTGNKKGMFVCVLISLSFYKRSEVVFPVQYQFLIGVY